MRVYVTGPLMVEAEAALVRERDLPGSQGRVVLAMLATEHRRAVSRDELADELWADRLPQSWETALRAIVSKLRRALAPAGVPGDELISSAFGCYRLRLPPGGWLDLDAAADAVHEAEAQVARGEAAAACSNAMVARIISGRPFLHGFYGPWTLARRERIRRLNVRASECLTEAWSRRGDHVRSALAAEHAVTLDPYREVLHQRLIRSHALAGDRAAAARAFVRLQELMERDLGVRPTERSLAAYRDALEIG